MTITKENYYDFPAISASSLQYIDPNMGGSPKKFDAYISGMGEKKDSLSMERGRILHKYYEDPSSFFVSGIAKPSEKITQIVETVFNARLEAGFDKFDDVEAKKIMLNVARSIKYHERYSDEVLTNKLLAEGKEYFEHLKEGLGMIVISEATRDILLRQIESLKPIINQIESDHKGWKCFSEYPLTWELGGLPVKGLIDKGYYNEKLHEFHLYDLKTTSTPISKYMGYKELVGDATSFSYRDMPGPFHWYKTYRQIAMYCGLIQKHFKGSHLTPPKVFSNIIVVESIDFCEAQIKSIADIYLQTGAKEIENLLIDIARSSSIYSKSKVKDSDDVFDW